MTRRFPYAFATILVAVIALFGWAVANSFAANAQADEEAAQEAAVAIKRENARSKATIQAMRAVSKSLKEIEMDEELIATVELLIANEERALLERQEDLLRVAARGQQNGNGDDRDRDLQDELHDLSEAIKHLNQGYTISGVRGHTSSTAGSRYVDKDDPADEDPTRPPRNKIEEVEKLRREIDRLQNRIVALEST